jgi:hypothetical protein
MYTQNTILKSNNLNNIQGMSKRLKILLQVLLADIIIPVKQNNSLFKISIYLQTTFATKTHLLQGITFAQ